MVKYGVRVIKSRGDSRTVGTIEGGTNLGYIYG
jgi:hypothetical protein